jgi:hypothetical protein
LKINKNRQVTEGITSASQTIEGKDDAFWFNNYSEKKLAPHCQFIEESTNLKSDRATAEESFWTLPQYNYGR